MALRRQLEAWVTVFPSNLAPIVGQQVTLTGGNADVVSERIALLQQRAAADECDVVVSGRIAGGEVTFLYDPTGDVYVIVGASGRSLPFSQIRTLASTAPLTFTAVPVGTADWLALEAAPGN